MLLRIDEVVSGIKKKRDDGGAVQPGADNEAVRWGPFFFCVCRVICGVDVYVCDM